MRSLAVLVSLSLSMPLAAAEDIGSLLQQAESLLGQAKPAEAYQLLAPLEAQQKGDTRFDYLLGAALLESGQPALAIPVLKRALAVNPLFAAARLDLGRAHFAVGNFDEAKSAFNTVAYQNPPPAAQQAIAYHLAEIEQRGKASNLSGNAYVSVTAGRDSNVPGGLDNGRLYVIGQPEPFFLDEKNIKAADAYVSLGVGAEVRLALDTSLAMFAAADIQKRDNNTLNVYDAETKTFSRLGSTNATLNLGLEKNLGPSSIKISGNFGRGLQDNANLRRNNGGTFEWRYNVSRLNQFSFYAQAGQVRFYPIKTFRDYDANQRLAGLSWFSVSEAKGNPSFSLGLNYGRDIAVGNAPDGTKHTVGVRLGGQIGVGEGLLASSGLGYSRDQFDKERPILFDTKPIDEAIVLTRQDRKLDVNLGLTWVPEINWSVRPSYTYTRSTSNVSIYEFTRNDFSLSVRRDFR
jgi:outer membrane protein